MTSQTSKNLVRNQVIVAVTGRKEMKPVIKNNFGNCQRNPNHSRLTILLLLTLFALNSCTQQSNNESDQFLEEIAAQEKDAVTIAKFSDHFDQRTLSFVKNDNDFNRVSVYDDDVIQKFRVCNDENLLICLESPFNLYLPVFKGSKVYRNDQGISFSIEIANSHPAAAVGVCDLNGFWLKIESESESELNWYLFKQRKGLVNILRFQKQGIDYGPPSTNLSIKDGKLFSLDEICAKQLAR